MHLDKNELLEIFSDVALSLGLPAEICGSVGMQCFNSMARSNHALDQEGNALRKHSGLPQKPLLSPEAGLVQFLGSLPDGILASTILNNVKPFVDFYGNQVATESASAVHFSDASMDAQLPLPVQLEVELEVVSAPVVLPIRTSFVAAGDWSGKILQVTDGVVSQRINRAGDVVHHDVSKLSSPVSEGAVVDITYLDGLGVVGGRGGPDRGNGR